MMAVNVKIQEQRIPDITDGMLAEENLMISSVPKPREFSKEDEYVFNGRACAGCTAKYSIMCVSIGPAVPNYCLSIQ